MSKIIKVKAGVRYYEDGAIWINEDWQDDVEGNETKPNMPCCVLQEDGTYTWNPIIDVEKAKIINWEHGVTAQIHYKVCDECEIDYFVDDEFVCNNDIELYVPDFLCTTGEGFGDYIIMEVKEDGTIVNWTNQNKQEFNDWVDNNTEKDIANYIIDEE